MKEEFEIIPENFELIVKKYNPLIKSVCASTFRLYASHYELDYDDLRQEALIIVFSTIRTFKQLEDVSFGPYLKTSLKYGLNMYAKYFLPHLRTKDEAKSAKTGKWIPKYTLVQNSSISDIEQ